MAWSVKIGGIGGTAVRVHLLTAAASVAPQI